MNLLQSPGDVPESLSELSRNRETFLNLGSVIEQCRRDADLSSA
jgi:hypothetical protein